MKTIAIKYPIGFFMSNGNLVLKTKQNKIKMHKYFQNVIIIDIYHAGYGNSNASPPKSVAK